MRCSQRSGNWGLGNSAMDEIERQKLALVACTVPESLSPLPCKSLAGKHEVVWRKIFACKMCFLSNKA